MSKNNIVNYGLRLNLNNEKHLMIYEILRDLNLDIHKSINQFLINAVDFYIRSFDDDITNAALSKKEKEYITQEDIQTIKAEILSDMKDELIRLFTSGNPNPIYVQGDMGAGGNETVEDDDFMKEIAGGWG